MLVPNFDDIFGFGSPPEQQSQHHGKRHMSNSHFVAGLSTCCSKLQRDVQVINTTDSNDNSDPNLVVTLESTSLPSSSLRAGESGFHTEGSIYSFIIFLML
jgi:hypothetical protein